MTVSWDEITQFDMQVITYDFKRKPEIQHMYSSISPEERTERMDKIKKRLESESTFFVGNSFPYDIETGIQHDVIWTTYRAHDDDIENLKYFKKFVAERLGKSCDELVLFTNHPSIKSILEIDHHHVFYKS